MQLYNATILCNFTNSVKMLFLAMFTDFAFSVQVKILSPMASYPFCIEVLVIYLLICQYNYVNFAVPNIRLPSLFQSS